MTFINDVEYELMKYCLRLKGRWWANHFFRNKEVMELYSRLRSLNLGTVLAIVESGFEILDDVPEEEGN